MHGAYIYALKMRQKIPHVIPPRDHDLLNELPLDLLQTTSLLVATSCKAVALLIWQVRVSLWPPCAASWHLTNDSQMLAIELCKG